MSKLQINVHCVMIDWLPVSLIPSQSRIIYTSYVHSICHFSCVNVINQKPCQHLTEQGEIGISPLTLISVNKLCVIVCFLNNQQCISYDVIIQVVWPPSSNTLNPSSEVTCNQFSSLTELTFNWNKIIILKNIKRLSILWDKVDYSEIPYNYHSFKIQ